MTSAALVVLFLALVCSTFSTTSEQSADHGGNQAEIEKERDILNNMSAIHKTRTNVYNNTVNLVNAMSNLEIHKMNIRRFNVNNEIYSDRRKRVKRENVGKCDAFKFEGENKQISHPHPTDNSNTNYYKSIDCVTIIKGSEGSIIELMFVDIFRIEDHPDCTYDYLEIRDGKHGYGALLGKLCGEQFPGKITTTGPYAWLKFHSDDTIEYEGFHINVAVKPGQNGHAIPDSCYIDKKEDKHGVINTADISTECKTASNMYALDVLWTIRTPENTKIYLNFTSYSLDKPNECEENVVQVYGSVLEFDSKLAHYCGSVANSVTTKDNKDEAEQGNIMYVRLYASKSAQEDTKFVATYTAFRTLDPQKEEKCNEEDEFDCEDNTCIAGELKCNGVANCRLKADEDQCGGPESSQISKPHILIILIIFSLILFGMSFVFLFKCIRKLYEDHKLIKEHIRQSCEDRLDSLVGSRLTLDAKRLQRDSEPRVSLERDNHTNEMYKEQRSFPKHKQSSIDSDFIQETHLDVDDEPWRREVESVPIEIENIRVERNGRTRRSDMSKKEQSIRSRTKESEREEIKEKKEIRDVSVGAPDTKESGCQTRESLFQTDPPPSSDGSGSNSRGFSTFGYSGTTVVRPSPPAQTNTSQITIELLSQVPPHQESVKSQKKIPDRRPMSTETTRSAPDVIIVSKPIR